MTATFRPATPGIAPIIVMIAGGTNTGKSWSSLLLARGMAGPSGKIAAIDTEGGRLSNLAAHHRFDWVKMEPPFAYARFSELIETAEADGYGAIVIDSASMMQKGPGGYEDFHEAEIERLLKADRSGQKTREAVQWAARKLPSLARQGFLYSLLSRRIPIILSTRARELTEQVGNKIVPKGWQPTIHKEFIYDVTLSLTLRPEDGKGIIRHKEPFKLERDHAVIFRDGEQITAEHGAQLIEMMRTGGAEIEQYFAIRSDGKRIPFTTFDAFMRWWDTPLEKAAPDALGALLKSNADLLDKYRETHPDHVETIRNRANARIAGDKSPPADAGPARDMDRERADEFLADLREISEPSHAQAWKERAVVKTVLARWEVDRPDLFGMIREALGKFDL